MITTAITVLIGCSDMENIADMGLPTENIMFEEPEMKDEITQRAPKYNGAQEISNATRGARITSGADVATFGVSAAIYPTGASYKEYGIGSYFHNLSVQPGVNTPYYWPETDKMLSFYAYYPYGDSNYRLESSAEDIGSPVYSVTIPSDINSQKDFMTSQYINHECGNQPAVVMPFRHQLAALHFEITNYTNTSVTVETVSVSGVYYNGTFNSSTWTTTGSRNSSTVNLFELTPKTSIAPNATVDITGTSKYMLMVPQTLSSASKITVATDNGEYDINITGTWEAGKTYNYNLEIRDGIIVSNSTEIVDWKENKHLRFTALESGTFTLTIPAFVNTSYLTSVSYSIDEGQTWVTTNNTSSEVVITTPTVSAGNSVLWKGNGIKYAVASGTNSKFSSTGRFKASGNIMSLLYGDDYENKTSLSGKNFAFSGLFNNCTNLVTPPELPASTLAEWCYTNMFQGCTSLTTAPELPATTLANYCYQAMFKNCTSLTNVPDELPATTVTTQSYTEMFMGCTSLKDTPKLPSKTLGERCYQQMFRGCENLIMAPELPATTLANQCYKEMFYGCSKLTVAPELPATTLVNNCYSYMFYNCTNLSYIKAAFTTTPSASYTNSWVSGVASIGKFFKNSAATWNVTGINGVPSGWTTNTYTP